MVEQVDERRIRSRNAAEIKTGTVVYWMQRDQRVHHNWALLYAQQCAKKLKSPLVVVFNVVPVFGTTTLRQYDFMFRGLQEVEAELVRLQIPFILLQGNPTDTIVSFVNKHHIGHVVTDMNPLRFTDAWREKVSTLLPVRLTEVDAHNVVPVWYASTKEEFAAYTLRPKLKKHLLAFLTDIPHTKKHFFQSTIAHKKVDWKSLLVHQKTNHSVLPVSWLIPGAVAGNAQATDFLHSKLEAYEGNRNNPNIDGTSGLSPYFHFGQVSPQKVAWDVQMSPLETSKKEAFLEELIVRRELADNYCFYNKKYDTVAGAHDWAQKTIAERAKDTREFLYSREEFETAHTHDELWNAAQLQMVEHGKMHGFMRMYWAKKILEWTPDVQTAIDIALYLNDTYELDGTDPNGVTGVMWSICGVHDRAWTERPVFGKIRYMNYNGCKRKFDVKSYSARFSPMTPSLLK